LYTVASDWPQSLDEVESIEDRASTYLKLIQAIQPHGPYQFVGFCLGGTIAFEMAKQLLEQGEPTSLIGMINTWAPLPNGPMTAFRMRAQRAAHRLRSARRDREVAQLVRHWLNIALRSSARRKEASRILGETGLEPSDERAADALLAHTIKVSAAYRPRCYNGLVHLFMCTDDPLTEGFSADLDPRLKWRQLVAEVRVVELTGGH